MDTKVRLELSRDQALVLFEWLARSDDQHSLATAHEAEQIVLWVLEGELERALTTLFSPEYEQCVAEARERVLAEKVERGDGGG